MVTNMSWADAAHLVFHLHTYHTYLQYQHGEYVSTRGEQQKTDRTLSLFSPVIEQQTPYATTQLGSSTCSTPPLGVLPYAVTNNVLQTSATGTRYSRPSRSSTNKAPVTDFVMRSANISRVGQ
jgi:hypothetical protein